MQETFHMGVSQNLGYHFGGPNNQDYSIWGSILGPPILGNYHTLVSLLLFQVYRDFWSY